MHVHHRIPWLMRLT